MTTLYRILLLTLMLFNCTSKKQSITNTSSAIKKNINTVLNNWHQAATEADFDAYFSKMDSVGVFIGTDASENWTIKEFKDFCKPYFDKGKAWDFKAFDRNIYIGKNKKYVWFDELLHTWMGTCRGSGVLEKNNEEWKIKHYVLSVAIPNDDINEIINLKKENDSLFLQKNR